LHQLLSRFREQTNIIWKRRLTFMGSGSKTQSLRNGRHCWSGWHTISPNPDTHKQSGLHRKEPARDSTESEGGTPRSTENSNRGFTPRSPENSRVLLFTQSLQSLQEPLATCLGNCLLPLLYHKCVDFMWKAIKGFITL